MLDILFWISIFTGGSLLILLALSLLGGLDLDLDIGGDADFDGDSGAGLGIFKSLLVFISMSTWVVRILVLSERPLPISVAGGVVVGLLSVYLLTKLLRFLIGQTEDNTWQMEDTIGKSGKVYLRVVPDSDSGIVQVEVNGAIHDLRAKSIEGKELSTGSTVYIHGIDGKGLLVSSEPYVEVE